MSTGQEIFNKFLECGAVSTDTRNIIPGSIFFALKGATFNGNRFADEALNKGAAWCVIDEEEYQSEKTILVKDVLSSLQELAGNYRATFKFPVLGITGTNGKTTTKELVSAVLKKKFNVLFTQGNLNNHIGVPLTILSVKADHNFAVIEMGANHIGEIELLCSIAAPDFGVITNIGKAHLEGFGSEEGVIKAKSELYASIRNSGGLLFVNSGNPLLMKLSEGIKRELYGEGSPVSGLITKQDPLVSFSLHLDDDKVEINSNLTGNYNLDNLLCACCVGNYFDVPADMIKEAIEEYIPSNNRSQVVKKGSNTIILDAYNANPSSMHAAIENLSQIRAEKKVIILGDMLELGAESGKEHLKLQELIRDKNFEDVILVGKEFMRNKLAGFNVMNFETSESASEYIKTSRPENSLILIKGSRGIKLEKITEVL